MDSPLLRYSLLAAITLGHAGLLLSMSHASSPVRVPEPLPMKMVAVPMDVPPQAMPLAAPVPPKPAPPKPQKKPAVTQPAPKPAPTRPLSPKAITTTTATTATSNAPVAPSEQVASTAPAPKAEPAPAPAVVPPTHIGGHLGNPRPVYPPLSIELGEAGTVGLRVAVSAEGRATDVSLARSSGFPRLDRSALQAVRSWRFRPAMRGNDPIPYTYIFSVEFDLSKA